MAGNLVWFHTDFMLRNLPYMPKVVDKKQQIQAGVFISDRVPQTQAEKEADRRMAMQAKAARELYLIERSQNISRCVVGQVSQCKFAHSFCWCECATALSLGHVLQQCQLEL